MPLLGQHSQNPGGSQGLAAALQKLAAMGPQGQAIIATIARGGTTPAGAVPGWNEAINWGEADTGQGNTGGRAADRSEAQAFLSGDQNAIQSIEANKAATHKDWTGGTLAGLAPIAAAFIPGVGPLAAAGLGALGGGLESAAGITNDSFLGGAARGGALGGAAGLAKSALTPGTAATGAGSAGIGSGGIGDAGLTGDPLTGMDAATGAGSTAQGAGGLGGLVTGGNLPAGSSPNALQQLLGTNSTLGTLGKLAGAGVGIASGIAGANQQSQANDINKQLLAQIAQERQRGMQLGRIGAVGNPFSQSYSSAFGPVSG